MKPAELIAVNTLSVHYNIEHSFVLTLKEAGLIEVVEQEQEFFVPADELRTLEKLANFYYEMGINIEGIETISHLLERTEELHAEILRLRNKVQLYEVT
jgi:DNA-binding transcriptional ArsR family regulator